MVTITNTQPGGIGLPGGPVISGNGSVDLDSGAWGEAKKHPVIAARLKDGHLTTGKDAEPEPVGLDKLSDAELAAKAKDLKINADGRWGRERLIEEIKKAETKA